MKIKKGELVRVIHSRKGTFIGRAKKDFDTIKDQWFPIVVCQDESIKGLARFTYWENGDAIPCRNSLCRIDRIKEKDNGEDMPDNEQGCC